MVIGVESRAKQEQKPGGRKRGLRCWTRHLPAQVELTIIKNSRLRDPRGAFLIPFDVVLTLP